MEKTDRNENYFNIEKMKVKFYINALTCLPLRIKLSNDSLGRQVDTHSHILKAIEIYD